MDALKNMDFPNQAMKTLKTLVTILTWVVGWALATQVLAFVQKNIKVDKDLLNVIVFVAVIVLADQL